jgi:hypothetical protein
MARRVKCLVPGASAKDSRHQFSLLVPGGLSYVFSLVRDEIEPMLGPWEANA